MNILLIDVDSKIPNLALMKISAWHKSQGDHVSFTTRGLVDKVYISCIFKWNRSHALGIAKMFKCEVDIGGHGVNDETLRDAVEHIRPDYSLYPGLDYSIGYTSRGCIRRCDFCDVWRFEGPIRDHASIGEFWDPVHKKVLLLDNNFLASPHWRDNICFLLEHELQVSFCQGLDIRLVNDENASWLNMIAARTMSFKSPMLYFAFDTPNIEKEVRSGIACLRDHSIPARNLTFYILAGHKTTHEQDMHRFEVVRSLGANAYIMKYNDRRDDPWLNHFDRWVNRHIYTVSPFEEYDAKIKGHRGNWK